MGAGRGPGRLRWAGVGRTGRGDAGVGRVVPVFERDLRAAEVGTSCFLPLYLATLIQRSTLDCFGGGRALAVCGFLLAGTGAGLGGAHVEPESAAAWSIASDLGGDAGNFACDRSLPVHGVSALPADHGDLMAFEAALGGRDGDDRVDHLRRPDPFQCAA